MGWRVERIERLEPRRRFECRRCDREGMVSPRGVYRRFLVTMAGAAGERAPFCVVCASILSGRRQGELLREGRAGRAP